MMNNNSQILDYSRRNLTHLDNLPESLEILNCSFNNITRLDNLPINLKILNCSSNKLTQLDYLPESLVILDCSRNYLTQLDNLPQGLTELICSLNEFTSLDNLPSNLKLLNCHDCQKLMYLKNLPQTIINLDCSKLCSQCDCILPQELKNFEITRIDKNIIINGCEINPEIIYFTIPLDRRIYYSKFYSTGSGPPPAGLIKMNVNGCDVIIHGIDYIT